MSIPQDANFLGLSCQLGGLRLNGLTQESYDTVVTSGTAQSLTVLTIDDPAVAQVGVKSVTGKFLQVKINGESYFIPLYQ